MRNITTTQMLFGLCAIAWVVVMVRVLMNVKGPDDFEITVSTEEVQAFARSQLSALQERSFSEDMELCGIIFEDSEGKLGTTPIISGEQASCDIAYFDEPGMAPVASYHTHGAYSDDYDSEVPSLQDIESDIASQMDGYIATPGGRFWRVDWEEEAAILICGEGCLRQDTRYEPCPGEVSQGQFSVNELEQRRATRGGNC